MNWTYVALVAAGAAALWWKKHQSDKHFELTAVKIDVDKHGYCTIVYKDGYGKTDAAWGDPKTNKWFQVRSEVPLEDKQCDALTKIRDDAMRRALPKAKVLRIGPPKD